MEPEQSNITYSHLRQGEWTGSFHQGREDFPFTHSFTVNIETNSFTGSGDDGIGRYDIDEGAYDIKNGHFIFRKQYRGMHNLYYEGKMAVDGCSVTGLYKFYRGTQGADSFKMRLSYPDPIVPYSFELSPAEKKQGYMHVKYSTWKDEYTRLYSASDNDGEGEEAPTPPAPLACWGLGVWESVNIRRIVEYDWEMVYLARTEGSEEGDDGLVSWRFDVGLCDIENIELKNVTTLFDSGAVVWTLKLDNGREVDITDKLRSETVEEHLKDRKVVYMGRQLYKECELAGCSSFVLTAKLRGGPGKVSYQYAQLFRQKWDPPSQKDCEFPFEIKINLKEPIDWQTYKSISESMEYIFNNPDAVPTDVVLKLTDPHSDREERVPAHKFVLCCRSPVFYAMFNGALASSTGEINVGECTSESFHEFIRFIYTDTLTIRDIDMALELMFLAKTNFVPSIVKHCVEFIGLAGRLNVENVCTVFRHAFLLDEDNLQDRCCVYFRENKQKVISLSEYEQLETRMKDKLNKK